MEYEPVSYLLVRDIISYAFNATFLLSCLSLLSKHVASQCRWHDAVLNVLELVKKKKRVWLAPYLSLRYKNKWRLEFLMIGEVKARFSKVATLKPGGFFIHCDLHKVQSLEVSLVQMGALSLNYWLTKFIQEVAKLLKERYPAKTLYQIVCGIRPFKEERI